MSELLQEFVDSSRQRLRVDRDAGVIRGVKLLGLASRNGRRYRENALIEAIGLYEGAKVNVNHPKGHALGPRDYQDRLGIVRGVQFRHGEGLFGDLHFNPRHALSEQLVWDAENAPQNVGMSHNVLARTKQAGDEVVVEAITKVQSIDLVADPATTSGLFEQRDPSESCVDAGASASIGSRPLDGPKQLNFDALTLEHLRLHRPDLVREIEQIRDGELNALEQRLDVMLAEQAVARRRDFVLAVLKEHDLPLPTPDGVADSYLVSSQFVETLLQAPSDEAVRSLVEERAALVHAAAGWRGSQPAMNASPKSRDQLTIGTAQRASRRLTVAEFATAVRG